MMSQKDAKIYSIGELSRISDISVKTLRFYDQEGLLTPEIRNAETGYRYYSDKQILQVQIIKELKPYGLSLDDIRNILQEKDVTFLAEKLKCKIQAIEREVEKLNHQLLATQYAHNRLVSGQNVLTSIDIDAKPNKDMYPVDVYIMPSTWVLYTRYTSRLNADDLFLERCLELQRMRDQYNLFHSGPFIGIFHDGYASQFISDEGDLEVCLPIIKSANFDCSTLKSLGGFLVASTIHIGHYKNSYRAYLSLIEWIEQNGYEITGPPIEHYLLDPCNADDSSHYITKINFPVVKL